MSKSFTAMAILQLRDAGRLSLDDRADRYIPELKNAKLLTTDAPAITLRHLLTHAAGFPEDNPWGDRQLDITHDEFVQFLQSPISFSNAPGLTYEYSNLGFALLGYIIEKVSGKTYQQYINENILKPLGMNAHQVGIHRGTRRPTGARLPLARRNVDGGTPVCTTASTERWAV